MPQTTPKVTTELLPTGSSKLVTWELKNWCQFHDVIAASEEGCTLEIIGQVSLRFFLQPFEKDWRNVNQTSYIWQGYSLCAQILRCSSNIKAIKVTAKANIIYPISDTYPEERQSCTICGGEGTVGSTKSKGKTIVVIDEFIHLMSLKCDPNNGSKFNQSQVAVEGDVLKAHRASHVNDLTVSIQVTVFSVKENGEGGKLGSGLEESGEPEVSIVDQLKKMYEAEDNFSDLKLESKDKMSLGAHRFQLAARSPYFRRAIEDAEKKGEFDGIIKVEEVNGKTLMIILEWVYTEELNKNAGRFMEELVDAAILFELTGLLKILDKKLITICNEDNMFKLYQVAKNNGMGTAIGNIAAFIRENV